MELFWPSTKTEAPGKVAPLTDPSGVTTRAKYHRIGALRSRWGSLARIGFPVSVRDPATTHSFDAPLPIPVKVPELIIDAVVARVSVADRRQRRDWTARPRARKQPICPFRPEFGEQRRARRSLSLKFRDSW